MLRWPLMSTFTLFPELKLRGLVLWESHGEYFMIGHSFDGFLELWPAGLGGLLSCVVLSCPDSHLKLLDRGQSCQCNLAHRRSVTVLCMLYKIKSNPMNPLSGALPLPYMPAVVTRVALVAHRHSFAPPRCSTSQCRRISFLPLSVSLWNDLSETVYILFGRIGKVVASHAAVASSIPAKVALIYTLH